jgi:3-hydroxybutyryl-CoA dehydrogenase
VIEAIRESLDAKAALLRDVDALVPPHALVLTNTSSIPVVRLARTTARPGRFLGLHFFNPAPVMPLVEVVPTLLTEEWATSRAEEFAGGVLGKRVIRAQDRPGFVVNALLVPYLLSAVRMLENATATRDDIDEGMVAGCGMAMGPLRLCDLIGLDTLVLVAESLYAEHLDPAYAPPSLLRRYVDAGWLGRKSGRGFYDYETSQS